MIVQVLLLLEELLAQPEVSDFEDAVMNEDVGWLDIPVDNIVFIEILESVEKLFEVKEDLSLRAKFPLAPLATDEALEVLVVAILQNQIYKIIISSNNVLHLYDVRILPQLYKRFDLLTGSCHCVLDLLHIPNIRWHFYYLEGKLMNSSSHYFLEVAAVNLPIGPLSQSPSLILSVMIGKNFFGAFARVSD